jgi:hypothetical protein
MPSSGSTTTGAKSRTDLGKGGGNQKPAAKSAADDPLTDAEWALRELRQRPGSKQATDRLEHALQQLKERAKSKDGLAK